MGRDGVGCKGTVWDGVGRHAVGGTVRDDMVWCGLSREVMERNNEECDRVGWVVMERDEMGGEAR